MEAVYNKPHQLYNINMKKKTPDAGKELTPEELKKLKDQVIESLSIDRHTLLCRFPFMGNLLLRMDLVPVRDLRVRTACTDGSKIYIDLDFYMRLSNQERVFVLAHELMHAVLMHLVRCQTRIPDVYNVAADMEVNYCLAKQSTNGDLVCPQGLCFPPKSMQGKSAEVIYEWLMRKFKRQKKNGQEMKIPNGNPKDAQMGGFPSGGGGDSEDDDGDANTGSGENGSKTGNLEGQFDNHKFDSDLDEQSNKTGGGSGSGKKGSTRGSGDGSNGDDDDDGVTDQWGKVGFDPDYKPTIAKDFADKMREAVIAEAQRSQRTQGHLPAGLEGIIDALPRPEINWREELSMFVTSSFGDKRAWLPPQRRHVYNEMYFQSRRCEKIKVAAIIDTSGSCWGDLNKFFAEMNGLLKTFGRYELTIVQCDADVQDVTKYDDENPFPIDDPKAIEVNGCGGSDFRPAFKKLREDGIENDVDCIVVLTDGVIDFPQYPPSKPVLIILTKDGNKECCPWGKKIVFKEHSVDSE